MPAFNVYILIGKLDPHCAKTYLNFGITTPKDLDYLGDSGAHNPKYPTCPKNTTSKAYFSYIYSASPIHIPVKKPVFPRVIP